MSATAVGNSTETILPFKMFVQTLLYVPVSPDSTDTCICVCLNLHLCYSYFLLDVIYFCTNVTDPSIKKGIMLIQPVDHFTTQVVHREVNSFFLALIVSIHANIFD